MAKNGRVIIPISIDHHTKVRWTKESVRARGGNICFRASTVPMRDFFPLELGFCITVPKCQVSGFCPLSKLPSPTWNLTTNHIIIREEQFGGLLLPCLSTPLPSWDSNGSNCIQSYLGSCIISTCDCCSEWTTGGPWIISRNWRKTRQLFSTLRDIRGYRVMRSSTGMKNWLQGRLISFRFLT